jgi:hypothetical protein
MDTVGMTFLPNSGQKPSFRAARSERRWRGLEIEPIPIRLRLGTGLSLNPHRPPGQGIQKANTAQTAVVAPRILQSKAIPLEIGLDRRLTPELSGGRPSIPDFIA